MADLAIVEDNVKLALTPAQQQRMEVGYIAEDVLTGSPLYLDNTFTPPAWRNAFANGTSIQATVAGFAASHGKQWQYIGVLRLSTDVTDFVQITFGLVAGLTPGVEFFLSKTAGKFCPRADLVSGNWIVSLGTQKDATFFNWRPLPPLIQVP